MRPRCRWTRWARRDESHDRDDRERTYPPLTAACATHLRFPADVSRSGKLGCRGHCHLARHVSRVLQLPTRFDPLAWHIHEMLFGFVMAAVAGFLLTAIPNWTGRLPVRGRPLAMLAGLWLLGRIACLISADLPAWLAIVADLSFPVALLAVAAREIIAGRNWRNLPMTAPLGIFIIADLLMHLESLDIAVPVGLGWRLGLAAPILLISVIGGRIIPSFTRNWLSKRHSARLPAAPWRDRQRRSRPAYARARSLGGASRFLRRRHRSAHRATSMGGGLPAGPAT